MPKFAVTVQLYAEIEADTKEEALKVAKTRLENIEDDLSQMGFTDVDDTEVEEI